MKASILLAAAFVSLAAANPVAVPEPQKTPVLPSPCWCKPPICPMELIAECRCKNAAAQACYESYLAKGIECPKPTPSVCGVVARAAETHKPTKPIPTPPVVTPVVPRCGGLMGLACPTGYKCVDDPRDMCDPTQGGADCIGICVRRTEEMPPCGGKMGAQCPEGWVCVDDASDGCDPELGGKDCGGVCVLGPVLG
ncbi:hypothetical protein BU26DRAFT_7664 [Trematosphaeria pertusa]|uniref:Uncharacterized protein n=1 Tax=Trematosphaeria pertusa TaxID=390896 RepID=A0A6A6IZG3_9PLEO|nr:uncharacterized protein BU26DRAFT_7664 [Trematosphaeria pertusa]KAF2255756.1 hypothetical protein BU26DRAFT_7664 [Trematosphaeria pertusa]